jgi:predicted dehydrogenase
LSKEQPKLRVVVAGTSFGGTVQIPVIQTHPRTTVVAVSSGRLERAQKTALENGIPAYYTDFEEMLEREKPDIVSIVTPPTEHSRMVHAALARRIHTLCEKPFAMNVAQARQMKSAADAARGVVAMIDFEFRDLPGRAFAAELLHQGYIGKLRMVDLMVHMGTRSRAEDVGWDWWSDGPSRGGELGAVGSHTADMFWTIEGPPRRLFCDLATFVGERSGREVTSDDSFTLLMELASGARAIVQMTHAAGLGDGHLGFFGSEGELVIPNIFASEIRGGRRPDKSVPLEIPERYRLPQEHPPLRAPFRVLFSRMVDAVDNGQPSPSPNFEDGVNSQIVLEAAYLSAKEKRWVEL